MVGNFDRFLLGPGLFTGANLLISFKGGYVYLGRKSHNILNTHFSNLGGSTKKNYLAISLEQNVGNVVQPSVGMVRNAWPILIFWGGFGFFRAGCKWVFRASYMGPHLSCKNK